jgi:osmotically-inducible protein OsmY
MSTLTAEIERRLERDAGLAVAVEEDGGRLVLTGLIDSDELRRAAFDIVAEVAPDREIVDNLEIMDVLAGRVDGAALAADPEPDSEVNAQPGFEEVSLEAGDFERQRITDDPLAPMGPSYEGLDNAQADEGDVVWVPPTDPSGPQQDMISSLEMTSMDSVEVNRSVSDGRLSDDAIGNAVARELAEDAATTDLDVRVTVHNGTVRLTGEVLTLDDAESAEEVAARVPGVKDVREEIDVPAIEDR